MRLKKILFFRIRTNLLYGHTNGPYGRKKICFFTFIGRRRYFKYLDPRLDALRVIYDPFFDKYDKILSIDLDILLYQLSATVTLAEWIRRWTANPMCSARVGSNPGHALLFFNY